MCIIDHYGFFYNGARIRSNTGSNCLTAHGVENYLIVDRETIFLIPFMLAEKLDKQLFQVIPDSKRILLGFVDHLNKIDPTGQGFADHLQSLSDYLNSQ